MKLLISRIIVTFDNFDNLDMHLNPPINGDQI